MSFLKMMLGLSAAAVLMPGAELQTPTAPFAAHEWGTFTSVAREDGTAVEWTPLLAPSDLPCFVARSAFIHKAATPSLVRMETPVLYFYAKQPQTISVHIDFPHGLITEWYPHQSRPERNINTLDWSQVRLAPGPDLAYPMSEAASRYYTARNTDATPLRIGAEQEKMIFYRGVGSFEPPLSARYDADGALEIRNLGNDPLPFAIAFENQRGAVGFRIAENVTGTVRMKAPELTQDMEQLQSELASRLTAQGLYPKEARAMVNTWSDTWFGEGARVLYIVPRETVDRLLPLTIAPAPEQIQRVFVGRVEALSPRTRDTIVHALRSGDSQTLLAFGRFLQPFVAQISRTQKDFDPSPAARAFLRAIASGQAVASDGYGAGETTAPAECVE